MLDFVSNLFVKLLGHLIGLMVVLWVFWLLNILLSFNYSWFALIKSLCVNLVQLDDSGVYGLVRTIAELKVLVVSWVVVIVNHFEIALVALARHFNLSD